MSDGHPARGWTCVCVKVGKTVLGEPGRNFPGIHIHAVVRKPVTIWKLAPSFHNHLNVSVQESAFHPPRLQILSYSFSPTGAALVNSESILLPSYLSLPLC